jgi:uncharacterized protein
MSARISQYVLKVCGRCDLSCDHCYVYEHADQSWRRKPKSIAKGTVAQAARRIAEHASQHGLRRVSVILHGGEPLLLGLDGLRMVLREIWSSISPLAGLDITVHTNGVLLDERLCDLFADYGVRVGVSLDGDRAANDRHRRFSDGRSSHDKVLAALGLLRRPAYRHLYGGILCTIDLANDPIEVYEALLEQAPPRLDLLLPHGTWDNPPPRPPGTHVPYADWLGQIHARWNRDGRPVPIRIFDSLTAAWEGRPSGSEAAGLDPVDMLVIDTDGGWEQVDSLKTAFDGAPATGCDVFSHAVDDVVAHPGVAARRAGIAGLSRACQECALVRACGGGLYAHRYRSGRGFDNPSVYCNDLKALIPQVIAATRSVPRPSAVQPAAAAGPAGGQWSRHALSAGAFTALAAGSGDAAAMTALVDSRWSINRALVASVAARLDGGSALRQAAAEGWRVLSALDAEHPRAVREVLTYPYVQAWAARCLRPAAGRDTDLDIAHLAGIAAATALRAGIEVELALPVRNGFVYLPTVGAFMTDPGLVPTVLIRASPDGVMSRHGPLACQAIRSVTAGAISVAVDDVDPFRDCEAWTPMGRLAAAVWRSWRSALIVAADELAAEDLPDYATVIGIGLRAATPVHPRSTGHQHSGTSRDAFGALAVALPEDPGSLSELIVHEMQHVKLAALADLYELFDRGDGRRHAVPWRADLRPIGGVLHGTYAHLALAEFWLSRSRRDPTGEARQRFLMYRSWVESALATLQAAGSLLPHGELLVSGMLSTVEGWDRAG